MKREAEFITEFKALDVSEGRETDHYLLEEPFRVYSAVLEDEIELSKGFEFDGESIPAGVRWLVPPFGQSKRGAAVHDWLYRHRGYWRADGSFVPVTRKQADAVYHELVRLKGLPAWRSNMRWAILRIVGWSAWNANQRNDPYAKTKP